MTKSYKCSIKHLILFLCSGWPKLLFYIASSVKVYFYWVIKLSVSLPIKEQEEEKLQTSSSVHYFNFLNTFSHKHLFALSSMVDKI